MANAKEMARESKTQFVEDAMTDNKPESMLSKRRLKGRDYVK